MADSYESRVIRGLCEWQWVDAAIGEREALKTSDTFTWNALEAMMDEAAADGGFTKSRRPAADYRIPLQYAPEKVSEPPWMGELKKTGKKRNSGAGLEWRLYFGEPEGCRDLVVVCGIWHKAPEDLRGYEKQEDSVAKAMGRFKHYCRTHKFTYPPFG